MVCAPTKRMKMCIRDSFKGAGRRFEVYGECNGAVVVDDYAHHPTELRATLTTAKAVSYTHLRNVIYCVSHMVGDDDGEVPPVPIPNTAVKLTRAQDS